MSDSAQCLHSIAKDVFAELLSIENSLEIQRQQLATRKDFTLSGAFFIFAKTT